HPAPVPVSSRGSDARHGRIEPGRRRSGRARGPVPRARLVPPRAAATLRVLRFTDLSASGICIVWITFRCGGRNAFGARIPPLSVLRPLRRFVVIHNCCVLCWLSGCLDKVVVSVGRRSPPLTTTEGRDLPRGSAKGVGSDEHGRGHKPALRRRRRGWPGWPGGHGSRSVPR